MYQFGVDIASYQGHPDFAQLARDGHTFCVSKLTGEGSYVNPYCAQNATNARAAGLIWGCYDWVEPQSWANDDDARAAARDYLAHMDLHAGDLITVDFETPVWNTGPLGTNIESAMRAYMETLSVTTQTKIGMYSGPYFLQETGAVNWAWLGDAARYYYWEAAPGAGMMADDSFWPATTPPFATVAIHQHQWHAADPGVVGEFDRDRFQGTIEELRAYGYQDQLQEATVSTTPSDPAAAIGAALQPTNATGEDVRYYIDAQGVPHIDVAFGGVAARILGVNLADVGISVVDTDGKIEDRSMQNNVFQAWKVRAS